MRLSANTRHEGSNPPISVFDDFSSKKPVKPLFYGLFSFFTNSHGFFRMQIQVIAGKKKNPNYCVPYCALVERALFSCCGSPVENWVMETCCPVLIFFGRYGRIRAKEAKYYIEWSENMTEEAKIILDELETMKRDIREMYLTIENGTTSKIKMIAGGHMD